VSLAPLTPIMDASTGVVAGNCGPSSRSLAVPLLLPRTRRARGCGADGPRHSDRHVIYEAISFQLREEERGVVETKTLVVIGMAFHSSPPCARLFDQECEFLYVDDFYS
jgi:hypothetical protein